jgi:hypothetical protein
VLGPLPQLHRVLVLMIATAAGLISGTWAAQFGAAPSLWVLAGGLAGIGAGAVLVHQPRTSVQRARHIRR